MLVADKAVDIQLQ